MHKVSKCGTYRAPGFFLLCTRDNSTCERSIPQHSYQQISMCIQEVLVLRRAALFVFIGILTFTVACGSGSKTTPSATTPAASNPPASSSQPPTPPAPSPNPAPVPTSDSYLATISSTTGTNPTSNGTVTIDTATNGAGTLQITGLAVSNGELQFCPGGVNSTCTNIAPVTTDAGGNATVNFTFPEKGTFSGVWQIVMSDCSSGCQIAASSTGDTGANFMSAELPAGNISGHWSDHWRRSRQRNLDSEWYDRSSGTERHHGESHI